MINDMTPERLAAMRAAWEETPETGAQIAARYGKTKNQVIGIADRGQWRSFTPGKGGKGLPRTMEDRLAALNAAHEAVKDATQVVLDNGGRYSK